MPPLLFNAAIQLYGPLDTHELWYLKAKDNMLNKNWKVLLSIVRKSLHSFTFFIKYICFITFFFPCIYELQSMIVPQVSEEDNFS